MIRTASWLVVVLGCLYALHQLALWMERRGWIYYRDKRGSSGSLGNAMLEVQAILEPSKQYVVEERRREPSDDQQDGDPPKTGARRS